MNYIQHHAKNGAVYAVLGYIHLCIGLMFTVVLQPTPHPVVAAVGPTEVSGEQVRALPALKVAKQGVPLRVLVPSVSIDLAVKPGSYEPENQTWTLDSVSAFYADRTVPANNNNGTTLLYGHGTPAVFGRIPEISGGAEAKVLTDTGIIFTYRFQSSRQVTPTDTSVLNSGGPPTLVLQTCSGPFDKYRTLVAFNLVGVSGYE